MLRTGQLLQPRFDAGFSTDAGGFTTGDLASPRTGLAPAGSRELVARYVMRSSLFLTAPELLDAQLALPGDPGHHPPSPSPSCISVCRLLGLVISSRRPESDKELEIMVLRHQVRVLQRQLHGRVRYRPVDRASSPPSIDCFRGRVGRPSPSPPTAFRWHRELARRQWRR